MNKLFSLVPDRGQLFATDVLRKLGMQRCAHCGEVVPVEAKLCPECDNYLPEHIVPSNCHAEPVEAPTETPTDPT